VIGLSVQPGPAVARPLSRAVIACSGLDVLHRVRLKVAVSLLMADFIQAELIDDDGRRVDLLVGDADDGLAQQRLLDVARAGGAVLAISRQDTDGAPARLLQGASVRQIHQQLLGLLVQGATPGPVSEPLPKRTLFHWLAHSRGQPCLLHNGLVKLALDAARQKVWLLRDLPLDDYARQAASDGWSCEVLDAAGFARACADAVAHCSWETLCWQVAVSVDAPLPAAQVPDALHLQGWPDIAVERLPEAWLLPLASLLQRPWNLQHLGRQAGITDGDVRRIAAAVCWSGLGHTDAAASATAPVPLAAGGLFARIARRFGLALTSPQARH